MIVLEYLASITFFIVTFRFVDGMINKVNRKFGNMKNVKKIDIRKLI